MAASGSVRSYRVVPPTVVVEKWLSTHEVISLVSAEPPAPGPPPLPAAVK